jgi:hypothetical protein
MNGDVLMPTDAAITFLPLIKSDPVQGHYLAYQLRSSRRYRPPDWP